MAAQTGNPNAGAPSRPPQTGRSYNQGGRGWIDNYKRVEERVYEFRRDHPDWTIYTEPRTINNDLALFRAEIRDEQGNVRSVGHKHVRAEGRDNYVELAETGAVGRALHFLGYQATDTEE